MKKLLIVATAIMMVCGAHAASFNWGFTNAANSKDANGNWLGDEVTPVAYLFLGTVAASESAFILGDAVQLATVTGFDASWNLGSPTDKVSSSSLEYTTAGQAFTLIILENNGKSLSNYEGNYILAKGSSEEGVDPMDPSNTWGVFIDTQTYDASGWSSMTASVPEPTSGLLLLIGVAGLALKRKHA